MANIYVKKNLHIEIVWTDNPEFSSLNRRSCGLIYDILRNHYSSVGVMTVDTITELDSLVAKQPDLVFLGMKRLPRTDDSSSDIWLSEY